MASHNQGQGSSSSLLSGVRGSAAVSAVLAVGAVKASVQPSPDWWRVFLDPAGHPFCLCLRP